MKSRSSLAVLLSALGAAVLATAPSKAADSSDLFEMPAGPATLLTEPFLQLPGEDSVRVVWMTNFRGIRHEVIVGEGEDRRIVRAVTRRMNRLHEDAGSTAAAVADLELDQVVLRPVWRHEAIVDGLEPDVRVPYRVRSVAASERAALFSGKYTLKPLPSEGQPQMILLVSDQQNRYGYPAAMQLINEKLGPFDAVLVAGDYVDVPRRASEWFDRFDPAWLDNPNEGGRPFPSTRPAFFPSFQGTYDKLFPEFPWSGGEIIQHAPMMGSIGNHEVPGRYRPNETYIQNGTEVTANLNSMDSDPQPRWFAELRYEEVASEINPFNDPKIREQWIRDNSHDFEVHRAMWSHPRGPEGEGYWAQKMGDVYVISLNFARIWRTPNIRRTEEGLFRDRGKYTEIGGEDPAEWGFGDFHFYAFGAGSQQYAWLQDVLASEEFRNTRYKVVLAHHTVSGLGDNVTPVHADNVMYVDFETEDGETQTREVRFPRDDAGRIATWHTEVAPLLDSIVGIRYEYPLAEDIWLTEIEPLLIDAGVQLVHIGHSHVWNRTQALGGPGLNYLETSSAGNTFGAYWTDPATGEPWDGRGRGPSNAPANDPQWNAENYPLTGDAHGREALFPTLANPMQEFAGQENPLPFVSSNEISTVSVLDTAMGAVRSFALDLTDPSAELIEFDRFYLEQE